MTSVRKFFRRTRGHLPRSLRGILTALFLAAFILPYSWLLFSVVRMTGFYECEFNNTAWICNMPGRILGPLAVMGVVALPWVALSRFFAWFTAVNNPVSPEADKTKRSGS